MRKTSLLTALLLLTFTSITQAQQTYDVSSGHFISISLGVYDAAGANRRTFIDMSPTVDVSSNMQLSTTPLFFGIGFAMTFWSLTSPRDIGNRYEVYFPFSFSIGGSYTDEGMYFRLFPLITYDEGKSISKDSWHSGFGVGMFYRRNIINKKLDLLISIDVYVRPIGSDTDTGGALRVGVALPITGKGY